MTGFEVLLSVGLIKENCDKLSGLISRLAERYDEFGRMEEIKRLHIKDFIFKRQIRTERRYKVGLLF